MLSDDEEELRGVPLLVFANKQDVDGSLKPGEISDALGLAGGETGREWSVRGSCAIRGDGLEEGLDWFVTTEAYMHVLLTTHPPQVGERHSATQVECALLPDPTLHECSHTFPFIPRLLQYAVHGRKADSLIQQEQQSKATGSKQQSIISTFMS